MKTNVETQRAWGFSTGRNQCVWMKAGRVLFKLCSHNYACKDCAYDQLLDEYDRDLAEEPLAVLPAAVVNRVPGFMAPALNYDCCL